MLSCRKHGSDTLRKCCQHELRARRLYSSKVRAFPFVLSKEKAIEDLSWNAAVFTAHKAIATGLKRIFPFLDVPSALRPTRVQAVYLPTWIVDAELGVTAWMRNKVSDNEFIKEEAQVQFTHSNVPAFVFSPLSSLSLAPPQLLTTEPLPWSEDLRQTEGDDILCLPFSLTPFPLLDAARSLPPANTAIRNILRFDPSSLREVMMAAYPVLIPVYLAQFQVNTLVGGTIKEVSMTAFVEAGYPEGRIIVEVVQGLVQFFRLFDARAPDLIIRGENSDMIYSFAGVRNILARRATAAHKRALSKWLNSAANSGKLLPTYRKQYFGETESQAAQAVDWNDVRIRPYTKDEREAIHKWTSLGADQFLMKMVLDVEEKVKRSSEAGRQTDAADTRLQSLREHVEGAEKQREEAKPAWLAQYELQQRLAAKPHDVERTSS